MSVLRRLFRSIRFEIFIVLSIFASVIVAGASLFTDQTWLETANLGFSLFFCTELSLRLLVAEDKKRYWRSFWLDWIASVPWDALLILLIPQAGLSIVWLRLLRLPRIVRILRIISISRTNLGKRTAYQLKKQLEKSLPRQFAMLAILSLGVFLLFGVIFSILDPGHADRDPFYFSLITLMSSDSIFEVAEDSGGIKTATILLAFLGMILFNGILIAIIVTRITEYLENVRAGRGRVEEREHLVVLGWHGLTRYLIQELEIYSQNEGRPITLVLLVEELTPEIMDLAQGGSMVDVVIRRGLSYNQSDIEMIAITRARAVFSLGHGSLTGNDSIVIKSLLTMESLLSPQHPHLETPALESPQNTYHKRRPWPHIVANLPEGTLTKFLPEFPAESVITFDPFFYSAKILASVVQNPDLYEVYTELFSFRGSEFYFCNTQRLQGLNYGQLPGRFPNIQICGLERNGDIQIAPPVDTILTEGDQLLILGLSRRESEASFKTHQNRPTDHQSPTCELNLQSASGLEVAIIGVNPKIPFIVEELEKSHTKIHIIDDQSRGDFIQWYQSTTGSRPKRGINYSQYSFAEKAGLDGILDITQDQPGAYPAPRAGDSPLDLRRLDRIIILADESAGDGDPGKIDADTIFKLLKVRRMIRESGCSGACQIVAEIMSPESEDSVRNIQNVRFVIGTQIMGKLLGAYMLEPASEQIARQIIQNGGINLSLAHIQIPGQPPEFTVSALTQTAYQQGCSLLGILREGRVIMNPQQNLQVYESDLAILLIQDRHI